MRKESSAPVQVFYPESDKEQLTQRLKEVIGRIAADGVVLFSDEEAGGT